MAHLSRSYRDEAKVVYRMTKPHRHASDVASVAVDATIALASFLARAFRQLDAHRNTLVADAPLAPAPN